MNLTARCLTTLALVSLPLLAVAKPLPVPSPPSLSANSYILVDAKSHQILAEKRADDPVEPASITKLMSTYIAFDMIKDGNISLKDEVRVSDKAQRMGGSRMFIEAGKKVPVELLLHGVITSSGNDATVALAEYIAGSEETFADYMNRYAEYLDLDGSHFVNATGWPADHHLMSAHDMARVMQAIIEDFPDLYEDFFHQKQFTYNGIKQSNRNELLWTDDYVDGGKTGHTDSAGYGLVASGKRNNMRLITAVTGTNSSAARTSQSQSLMHYGYRFFETSKFFDKDEQVTEQRIWSGDVTELPIVTNQEVYVSYPRGKLDDLETSIDLPKTIKAPIKQGEELGSITIRYGDMKLKEIPLYAGQDVDEGGIIHNLIDSIKLNFQ